MTKQKKVSRSIDSAPTASGSKTARGSRKKRGPNALEVLGHIEELVSDDGFEMIAMSHCSRAFTGDKKIMYEKLSAIYRAAHGFNPQHSCHHVHNKVATADKDLRERADTIVENHWADDKALAKQRLFQAIFRELVAVRNATIKQCGEDCRWDAGYEAGRKSRHD